jgi:hypothetical protein
MRLAGVSLREVQAWLNAQGVSAWDRGEKDRPYYRAARRWADDGAMSLRELWCMEERELVDEGARRFFGGVDRMQRAAGGGSLGSMDDVLTQLIWEMWPVFSFPGRPVARRWRVCPPETAATPMPCAPFSRPIRCWPKPTRAIHFLTRALYRPLYRSHPIRADLTAPSPPASGAKCLS